MKYPVKKSNGGKPNLNVMPTWNDYRQILITKLVVALSYNLIQYYKFTIGLHLHLISSMLAKFLEN